MRVIREGGGTAFDPVIARLFCRLVMPYPVGTEVPLPDGRIGVVAEIDPDRPEEPLVRAGGTDVRVDLREQAA